MRKLALCLMLLGCGGAPVTPDQVLAAIEPAIGPACAVARPSTEEYCIDTYADVHTAKALIQNAAATKDPADELKAAKAVERVARDIQALGLLLRDAGQ